MSLNNGIITAPVSIEDVRQCLNDVSTDVGNLCSSNKINRWSKYKPVYFNYREINTVSNQWDKTNNRWLTSASWWRGTIGSSTTMVRECGYEIPCVTVNQEYRSQAYYTIDNMAIPGGYTAPSNVPSGVWQYSSRIQYRLTDFAGYNHRAQKPLEMSYPATSSTPIVLTTKDVGVSFSLVVNNYADRTNGLDRSIFANDINKLSGAQLCAKLDIQPYNDSTGTRRTYELTGGSLSDNGGNLPITILRKLLQTSTSRQEFLVNIKPYLRKVESSSIKLYSVNCENDVSTTLHFILVGTSYKMRFQVGEANGAGSDCMFYAGYSSQRAGVTMYPVVGDDFITTKTTGHYIGVGDIFVKSIINDVFNTGGLDDSTQYIVDVYVEDLNEDDYMKCIIPKTRIMSFTTGRGCQGYGYRGSSTHGGSGAIDVNLSFANTNNNGLWVFGQGVIPILTPYGSDEAWPPGTLNPNNDVIAKFRVTAEIRDVNSGIVSVPQKIGNKGDGSYKKINESYQTDNMHFWRDGYVFTVKEVKESGATVGYEVVLESTIGITTVSLDYSEVSDNFGSSSWLPLPSDWESSTSLWKTEA